MTCPEAREALSPYLDGALPEDAQEALRSHLGSCSSCHDELAALRALSRLLKSLPRRPLPDGFFKRLNKRRTGGETGVQAGLDLRPMALALAAVAMGLILYRARIPMEIERTPVPAAVPAAIPAAALSKAAAGGAPLGAKPSLTNEQLQGILRAESEADGWEPAGTEPSARAEPFLGERLGEPGTRQQAEFHIRRLSALRRAVEESDGKPRGVPIAGKTAVLLAQKDETHGRALETEPAEAPPPQAQTGDGWSGPYAAGHPEGTLVIRDAATWFGLWKTLSKKPVPAVDFAKEHVVAVFLGPRPSGGHSVEFVSETVTAEHLVIEWRERVPAPGRTPPAGATTPYAFKRVPASERPARFIRLAPLDLGAE